MQGVNRSYAFLDCGHGRRLERFGGATVSRPAPAALAAPRLGTREWDGATLTFERGTGWKGEPPPDWSASFGSVTLQLRPAAQGQIGVFPEHAAVCDRLDVALDAFSGDNLRALNLFAHTGLATLRLAAHGKIAETIHVDAAAAAVRQARENADVSELADAAVRWLVDDALSFLRRDVRRGRRYDVVLADPPAFGRSKKGGEWKLERDLPALLDSIRNLLPRDRALLCLTCHREGWRDEDLRRSVRSAIPELDRVEIFPLRLAPGSGAEALNAGFACLATFGG